MTAPDVRGLTRPAVAAELLAELRTALTRYVVLPSDVAADAVVLWIAASHGVDAFSTAPRLVIRSPEKRCGKSRLLDVVDATCHDPLVTVNATVAAVFRSIGDRTPPTLLVDEADALFGSKKQAENNEDLRAFINAGHQRGRPVLRCVGPNQTPTEFNTFAFVALAGIGDLPDTITDRAVNITMRRRAPGEHVDSYRHRRDEIPLHALRDRVAAWVDTVLDDLADAEPEMPVEDRAGDSWEPLVAVADAAGGSWPTRARAAALTLTTEADDSATEASLGVRLLADCRDVFAGWDRPMIASADLVRQLHAVEEAPWAAFDLDARGLARRLRQYGVGSRQVRPDGGGRDEKQVRGYHLEHFTDAFGRYLTTPGGEASPSVTPSHPQVRPVTVTDRVTDASVTPNQTVTTQTVLDLREQAPRDGVTDGDGTPRNACVCLVCGGALDEKLAAWGIDQHPNCGDPDE